MAKDDPPSLYDHPEALLKLGLFNVEQGNHDTAWKLARQILAERPDDGAYAAIARRILAKGIGNFHHPMLEDTLRNSLYHQAIRRAAPGRIVLDIGTGSGLLAMMAARAGAAHVIACETNEILANAARAIVAANGLQDKITIYNLHSTQLDREEHLHGGAELVISEIFARNLVSESVLPSLEHARTQLCTPDAQFLPPRASIRLALAAFPLGPKPIKDVEGFDLSQFNQLTDPFRLVKPNSQTLAPQSEPIDLFSFEFQSQAELPLLQDTYADLVAKGGQVDGVVQWLRIDFGDGLIYENGPGGTADMHWPMRFVPISRPRLVEQDEPVRIFARHTQNMLMIWD